MCTFWRVAALRHFDVYILPRVASLSLLSLPPAFFPSSVTVTAWAMLIATCSLSLFLLMYSPSPAHYHKHTFSPALSLSFFFNRLFRLGHALRAADIRWAY